MSSTPKESKTKTKKKAKTVVKKPKTYKPGSKLRKRPEYKSFKLHKLIKHPDGALPSSSAITKKAYFLMTANSGALLRFVAAYGFLSLVFVSGIAAPLNFGQARAQIAAASETASDFFTNIALLGTVVQSSFRATGDISAMYQALFLLTSILAFIWLYRQQEAGRSPTIKQAFYKGMYPIIPFVLVMLLLGLYTVPGLLGGLVYAAVRQGGLAVTFIEQLVWLLLYLGTLVLSLYLVATGFVALFVVTLPDMTPMKAVQEARKLVMHRRFAVLIRVLALIIFIGLVYLLVVIPAIYVSPLFAQMLYFLLTILALPFAVAYLFALYRELL